MERFELHGALVLLGMQLGAVLTGLLVTGWLFGPRRVKLGNALLMAALSWGSALLATVASGWVLQQFSPEWGFNPWSNVPVTSVLWAVLTAVSTRFISHKRPSDMALGLICLLSAAGYAYLYLPRE